MSHPFRKMGCLLKALTMLTGILLLIFIFLLLFISPIAHWAIEKYAPRYTGRTVLLRDLNIGLLSGKIHMEGFRVMEPDQTDTFLYVGDLSVRMSFRKALFGDYRVDSVGFDTLFTSLVQHGNQFNFDDLTQRFTAGDTTTAPASTDTVHYATGPISGRNIRLLYKNAVPAAEIELSHGNLLIPSLAWNNPLICLKYNTLINHQGMADADMQFNQATGQYTLKLKADSVSTAPVFPYIAEYITSQKAEGLFSSEMDIAGNTATPSDISLKGHLAFDGFVLTDASGEKQAGWKSFSIEIDSINTGHSLYRFNNVVLSEPFLLVTLTREGNNLSALMKSPSEQPAETTKLENAGETPVEYANPFIMLAGTIGQIAEQYSKNEYGMNRFAIENGTIVYSDFLTNEKFSVLFQDFNLQTASFTDASNVVKFDISTLMNRYGNVKATLQVSNRNYRDFDLSLSINSLTMSVFNPYTKYYVAHPFWRGDISFTNTLSVKEGELKSNNRLLVKQIKVGDKVKSDSAFNIPVKLAVAILRDRKGNIDISIPIDGNLTDPNYHWGKAVLKIITNLLVKAATSPWDYLSQAIGGNPDDLKMVEFDPMQDSIMRPQRHNLDAIGKVLNEKPDLKISLTFRSNKILERDEVAVRMALKKWNDQMKQSPDSALRAMAMTRDITATDLSDTLFQKWLTQTTGITSPAVALPEKCLKAIGGTAVADEVLRETDLRRDDAVRRYLLLKFKVPDDAITIEHSADEGLNRNTPRPAYDVKFDAR